MFENLTDADWSVVVKDLRINEMRKRTRPVRQIFDAIFFVRRNGITWRSLPKRFGPWETAYYYFSRLDRAKLEAVEAKIFESEEVPEFS